jgi:hypothetical protein
MIAAAHVDEISGLERSCQGAHAHGDSFLCTAGYSGEKGVEVGVRSHGQFAAVG